MEFRTAHQDKWPHGVVIGSGTPPEFAFQTCNFLNMLYRNIHYSDNKPIYSSGSSMVISVVSHNLKCELSRLEKVKAEYEPDFKKEYRYYFETIMEELFALEKDHTPESEYTKSVKDLCDKLIFKGFDVLAKAYPEHGFYIKYPRPELISDPYIRDKFDNIVARK